MLLFCLILGLTDSALAVTQSDELELGRQVQMYLAAQKVLMEDPLVNHWLQTLCTRILKAAGPQPYPFHFNLINSQALNAFAVPGGYIYLHTETVISMENEGQLAAILSHEVAHITSRHYARRMEASKNVSMMSLAGILAGALLTGSGGANASALGQALLVGTTGASIQAMLAYSRADETEADNKGRQYMQKAGFSTRDMYGAFNIMNEKSYQLSSDLPTYMSTHPGLAARMARTREENNTASPPEASFLAIKDRVLALSGNPRRVRTLMNTRLTNDKNDSSAIHALGLLAVREQNLTQAATLLNQALILSPGNSEYLADLGELALRRKAAAEAVGFFEKAGRNLDTGPQITLGLARAYELLGRKKEAGAAYDQAVGEASISYPSALEMAGRFFGQNGQLAKGHFYLGSFFMTSGQPKKAVFHFKETIKQPDGARYKSRCEQNIRDLELLMEKMKNFN